VPPSRGQMIKLSAKTKKGANCETTEEEFTHCYAF